jgi:NAD(P)H-dependent FMN reductase
MKDYRIAVIVGSIRKDSFNRKLANGSKSFLEAWVARYADWIVKHTA